MISLDNTIKVQSPMSQMFVISYTFFVTWNAHMTHHLDEITLKSTLKLLFNQFLVPQFDCSATEGSHSHKSNNFKIV